MVVPGRALVWMAVLGGYFTFEEPTIKIGLLLVFLTEIVLSETKTMRRK